MSTLVDGAPTDHDLALLVALATLPGIGPATLLELRSVADLAAVWADIGSGRARAVPALSNAFRGPLAKRDELPSEMAAAAHSTHPAEVLARHRGAGRRILALGAADYPARLVEDPAPPALLFAEGDLSLLDGPTLAMVGTRNATRAGRELTARWAREVAAVGVSVVSGLALGIDGAAHQGAVAVLDGPHDMDVFTRRGHPVPPVGRPIGVVASGLDVAYPHRHTALHRRVAASGLLLSETPLGHRPTAWRFPARNRIIAGLADAVLVVESRSQGGSMLTASEAISRDTPVLAVPGHPTSPASAGTNDLLADGALVARDVDDLLVAIGLGGARGPDVADGPKAGSAVGPPVGARERAVLEALGQQALGLDELLTRAGLGLDEGSAVLGSLEESGRVVRTGSWFERADGSAARSGLSGWGR